MNDFVTLTCPSCGGKLQITKDVERFACGYCGLEHQVKRSGNIISPTPIVDGLRNVQTGVDKTASELAIKRLEREIANLSNQYQDVREKQDTTSQWFGGFFGAVFTLVSIYLLLNGGYLVGIILLLIAVFVIAVLVRTSQKSIKNTKSRLVEINSRIIERQSEIEKHRKIVAG